MTNSAAPRAGVVIAGHTLEGWLAAAVFARMTKALGGPVVIIPTPADAPPPPAIATTPALRTLHDRLKLDETDMLRHCEGTFRLGTRFTGFGEGDRSFVLDFSEMPQPLNGVAFHALWRRALMAGQARPFDDYCLGAAAGRKARFAPPSKDDPGHFDFALHLDGHLYQDYLRRAARHYGAVVGPALDSVERADDGTIHRLRLAEGKELTALFYIDATGPAAMMAEDRGAFVTAPGPGDACVSWSEQAASENASLTTVTATRAGYDVSIPLQSKSWTASVTLATATDGEALGWFDVPWKSNCIAIGRTAATLEPLEQPLPTLAATALTHLAELFPIKGDEAAGSAEYNRRMCETHARFAEFQALHHILAGRMTEEDAPTPLARKIEQFRSRGRIVRYDHESFEEMAYLSLFLGHGLLPERYDPRADLVADGQLKDYLSGLLKRVRTARDAMPDQRQLLSRVQHAGSAVGKG